MVQNGTGLGVDGRDLSGRPAGGALGEEVLLHRAGALQTQRVVAWEGEPVRYIGEADVAHVGFLELKPRVQVRKLGIPGSPVATPTNRLSEKRRVSEIQIRAAFVGRGAPEKSAKFGRLPPFKRL